MKQKSKRTEDKLLLQAWVEGEQPSKGLKGCCRIGNKAAGTTLGNTWEEN